MDASAAALREREKRWAAASSVVAAVGLTGFKIVVGVATGSLGILAEAAHSGLDLVAALMTLFAVRISGKPADTRHLYGHGKVENLSALFETLLLLLTCAWIIRSAIHRLAAHRLDIEVTLWSFAVMATSILVDASRSRVLYRAARKHHSDALEADALHFRTDIWSSSVVILGLICVKVSEWAPAAGFLRYSDAVAAIAVALIVVLVSVKLGLRTVQSLVDAAPAGADR
jgi:cation diffusion facilitator family transporter